ncbi:cyanase [Entomobacter blattae]|uniref:Cyanate hydratase n=1 Tax=Entomobacter blattae TaxID=2762277 RepID=A0A7H1NP20_9PROT|nr:cyanase [Entomobacter blattae]QNT77530.1 Cyanate hydratase [Entomobacter blattae]
MNARLALAEKIISIKLEKKLRWEDLAVVCKGSSKEFVTAALLGQHPLSEEAAKAVGKKLGLMDFEIQLLQTCPYRGEYDGVTPTDPTIYRLYEALSLYGSTIKELIHEEFGDGIMSAVDFYFSVNRENDSKGDRVSIQFSGKFLPYRKF